MHQKWQALSMPIMSLAHCLMILLNISWTIMCPHSSTSKLLYHFINSSLYSLHCHFTNHGFSEPSRDLIRNVDKGFRLLKVPKLVSSVLCPSYPSRSAVIIWWLFCNQLSVPRMSYIECLLWFLQHDVWLWLQTIQILPTCKQGVKFCIYSSYTIWDILSRT